MVCLYLIFEFEKYVNLRSITINLISAMIITDFIELISYFIIKKHAFF